MKELPFIDPIRDDLERVEKLLRKRHSGQHEAIDVAVNHLVTEGGKRLRPILVLLSAHLCNANTDRAIFAAAAAEMLHTATLIHDDLIDGSLMRRGVETLNARWPSAATILTGDYIFARAAYLIAQTESVWLMQRFAETLMTICNGEVRQMFNAQDEIDRQEYERRIYAKTASLIALSAEAGAILANAQDGTVHALRTYGERVGTAFQIVDDVLDFVADEEQLGKPIGSDLRQGLITLPTLLFLELEPDHPAVRQALRGDQTDEAIEEAVEAITRSRAIERSLETARKHVDDAKEALNGLPDTSHRMALLDLADFTVARRF